MMNLRIAASLVVVISSQLVAQKLAPVDAAAVERAAVAYLASRLPQGEIGLDPDIVREKVRIRRDPSHVQDLARALNANLVHADSVYKCGDNPRTCTLAVAALVRVYEPVATPDGARILVEVRQHSGFARQPIVRGTEELIVSRKGGSWKVVGVAGRSVT